MTQGDDEDMKKDHLNPYNHDHEDPEEKKQAEREDKIFRQLMSCSNILIGFVVIIIFLIFIFVYFFN